MGNLRRNPNVDKNQKEIVAALRQAGASVEHLHGVGNGCPDLLVGYHGKNILMEIKNKTRFPSDGRLNATQQDWHDEWRGQAEVVYCITDALNLLNKSVIGEKP